MIFHASCSFFCIIQVHLLHRRSSAADFPGSLKCSAFSAAGPGTYDSSLPRGTVSPRITMDRAKSVGLEIGAHVTVATMSRLGSGGARQSHLHLAFTSSSVVFIVKILSNCIPARGILQRLVC